MSSGKTGDREDTLYEAKARELLIDGRNWLRHAKNTSACRIDEALFEWVTIEELSKIGRTPVTRVYAHLNHLRKEHGLDIQRNEGKFKFNLEQGKRKRK